MSGMDEDTEALALAKALTDGDEIAYATIGVAYVVLRSDWLAAHDARVRAEALAEGWDEGYLRGALDQESDLERADNPYREAMS